MDRAVTHVQCLPTRDLATTGGSLEAGSGDVGASLLPGTDRVGVLARDPTTAGVTAGSSVFAEGKKMQEGTLVSFESLALGYWRNETKSRLRV
ncbi:unnamed protein product [Lampetra fluviatilis]